MIINAIIALCFAAFCVCVAAVMIGAVNLKK